MHILLFIAAIWLIASFPLGILTVRAIRDANGREDVGVRGGVEMSVFNHNGAMQHD